MKATMLAFFTFMLSIVIASADDPNDTAKWKARLGEIAREYVKYGRADRQYRQAPADCRGPGGPPSIHPSESKDQHTHGMKLYTVFSTHVNWDKFGMARRPTYMPPLLPVDEKSIDHNDPLWYAKLKRKPAPIGQVIVKESWIPKEISVEVFTKLNQTAFRETGPVRTIEEKRFGDSIFDYGDQLLPFVSQKGKYYQAEKKAGLFIMMKLDPKTPGTDEGWVYGTIADDLKTVTSVGKVEKCMKCHQEAINDRLIGLPNRLWE